MTDVTWTPGIIISFGGVFIIAIAVGFALKAYIKDRYKHMIYFTFMWGFWMIWTLFQAISDLFISTTLHLICFYALIGTGYATVFFVDALSRNSHDPWKLILVTFTSAAVILFSLDSDAVVINSDGLVSYPTMHGRFRIANLIQMGFIVAMLIYVNLRIYFNTPKNLMKYSRINLIGLFLYGVVPFIVQFTDLEHVLPGIANTSIALGVFISTFVLIRKPQIAFILPFKAYRILIVDSDIGLPIFSTEFVPIAEKFQVGVFSGFIKAIGTLFDFTIDKGQVREIYLDQAVLILHSSNSKPLVSILIADKSSPSLLKAFQAFSENLFRELLGDYQYSPDLNDFSSIERYVSKYFSFIPR
jgi:hypothetical protein